MSRRLGAVVVAVSAALVLAVAPPQAEAATFDFPSNDSTVVASTATGFVDSDEVGFFWSAVRGDLVSETFMGPTAVNRAILNVHVVTNSLTATNHVDWNLTINGVIVGGFSVASGFTGPITLNVGFPAIFGPTYTVAIKVTNTVPGGGGSHTLAYAGNFAHSIELLLEPLDVVIDVKPGSNTNPINLKSNGTITVAILTTDDFDATEVDGSTVMFAGASERHGSGHFVDVDRDGDTDWVGHFRVQETDILPGDTEACLEGLTEDGLPFEGCDSIKVLTKAEIAAQAARTQAARAKAAKQQAAKKKAAKKKAAKKQAAKKRQRA